MFNRGKINPVGWDEMMGDDKGCPFSQNMSEMGLF
jgi:hypothetical protein